MSEHVKDFTASLKIKLLNSSPYYAQANPQAEASNKMLIGLIKKKIEEKPRRWHQVLSEALWAYRVSKHGAINVMPFELVYGQEVVLLVEVNLEAVRIVQQDFLTTEEYKGYMMDNIDDLAESHLKALWVLEKEKLMVARAYNKRVREKSFQIGGMVWKTVLSVGLRDNQFGKWSPSWEGPYKITRIIVVTAYFVETLEGWELPKALNGKYLKWYYPSVWQGM
jgi:hypothetical protein